ncbi:hypothetical protein AgCh_031153 [Apium graveolens]
MFGSKYKSMKIPILKKTDYSTWRVKMLMFLEAIDDAYVEIIKIVPLYPMKTIAMTVDAPGHYIRKERSKWSDLEKDAMLKDAKVRNILYNSLENVMSNRVIACKTAKEIWDALETQCQDPTKEEYKGLEDKDTEDVSDPDADIDMNSEIDLNDPQVVEMAKMLVKGFRRMGFEKPHKRGGFNKRFSDDEKGRFRKSDGQYTKVRKFDKTKVKCYNCNEKGHMATECPKITGKALVTRSSNRDWMDSSGTDNDDECYALMATHGEDASGTDKVHSVIFPVDTDNLSELKTFLYSLHVTFKSKTIECDSLIADNKRLRERNDILEVELVCMHENKKACKKAQHNETRINIKTEKRGVKFVYEVGSTSKNTEEKKVEPRVPAKNKEDPKI